jgi:hypothetical protein
MQIRSVKLALVLLLVVCVGSALPAWAQSTSTGTVAGMVTDQTGAVVADATVTFTDPSTKSERSATTNDAGRYIFVDVNPGFYDIAVTKAGFATTKTEHLGVKVGMALTVNLGLKVGAASVVVEVTAVGTELQTMNATVGNTVTSLSLENLPSLGRDASTFMALQPGVAPDGSVAGAVFDQSTFMVDGGNNTNDMDGSMNIYTNSYAGDPTGGVGNQNVVGGGADAGGATGVLPTPQDSVEEFKVNTAGQTADFNSSAGSEVKVVTKRGSDTIHGTAYEYYKDNNWSSNSWENNATGTPVPSFHYNRYGFSLGGPLIPKEFLGGKTYGFFNYENFKFPSSETVTRNVPSPTLQLGLIADDKTGLLYNINPYAVTYNGTTYPGTALDPRGIGINPMVQQLWNKYEPASNTNDSCTQSLCDHLPDGVTGYTNIQGFKANMNVPTTSRSLVGRIDHDFGSKWHFMSSYRAFRLASLTNDQVDIGGYFPGDKLGTPGSQSSLPQNAFLWVAALTTNISSNITNDIHYSFLRNYWQWARTGEVPQAGSAVGTPAGALEFFAGQSHTQDLGPYNVNTQQNRNRFWDGHDTMFRDDLTMLKGNHLFQFGGTYQRNWDYHQRTDNGGGIDNHVVYELGNGTTGSGLASDIGLCSQSSVTIENCSSLSAAVLGIVTRSQVAYTRQGSTLTLNAPGSSAFDKSTIPFYNFYFSDTWHMKPTFTLTYGLGWTVEMPPVEATGKQVELVDASGQPVSGEAFLTSKKRAALLGENYNPELGFALVGNTGAGLKYPYNPYYGQFSPRIAAAWSPRFEHDSLAGKIFGSQDTVIRGGYGRIFGRLNGVNLVLVPLLGTGLIQPVVCSHPLADGTCGGTGSNDPNSAFRIGVDGLTAPLATPTPTLPQPFYPGYAGNISSSTGDVLDPNFRPNKVDSFNLTIQRQLSRKINLELGYIGRKITNEYQPLNLNVVPYMMTKGGQTFAQAYKNMVLQYCGGIAGLAGGNCAANAAAVTTQPFFEAAMTSAYTQNSVCNGGPCATATAAVVANEGGTPSNVGGNIGNAQVWTMWSDLDAGSGCSTCNGTGFVFGNSMMNNTNVAAGANGPQFTAGPAVNGSYGFGNYNAAFVSLKMADWKGLTMVSNFTWSKALGTGAIYQSASQYTADDAFDLKTMYGYQSFNHKFVYNVYFVYEPPFYKGQQGLMGRVLGGWTIAPLFAAGSGSPIELLTTTGDGQEYGAGDNNDYFGNQNAVMISPTKSGHVYWPNGHGTPGNPVFPSIFQDPNAINHFRNPILGLDNRDGGWGNLVGLPYWNLDLSIKKNLRVAERFSLELQGVFANVLNHHQWLDPVGASGFGFGLYSGQSGWGTLGGSAQEQPGGDRQIEVGVRVKF